jgi:hypothetical protein
MDMTERNRQMSDRLADAARRMSGQFAEAARGFSWRARYTRTWDGAWTRRPWRVAWDNVFHSRRMAAAAAEEAWWNGPDGEALAEQEELTRAQEQAEWDRDHEQMMADGDRSVHDPADPHCMVEEAMGWEHGSHRNGAFELTPEQAVVWDRATDLLHDIYDNHSDGIPARNDIERRVYADLDREARERELEIEGARDETRAEQIWTYHNDGLQAVSPQWLETQDGREFLDEIYEADRAEHEAELEAGA